MLEKEILELVKKNLPEATASVLKEYIETAEKLKISFQNLIEQKEELRKEFSELQALKLSQDQLDKKLIALSEKEKELTQREIKAEIEKLKHELVCAKERGLDIKELVGILVKNPRSIELMQSNVQNQWQIGVPNYLLQKRWPSSLILIFMTINSNKDGKN